MPLGSINNILNKNILSHYNNEFIKINMHIHSYLSKCTFKFFRIFYSDNKRSQYEKLYVQSGAMENLRFQPEKEFSSEACTTLSC